MRDEPAESHFRPANMDLETFAEYARDDLIANLERYRSNAPGVTSTDESMPSDLDERHIRLSFDFLGAIIDDPSIGDDIPKGVTLVLLPDDDPELVEINLQLGIEAARNGADVYIRHFTRTKPAPWTL